MPEHCCRLTVCHRSRRLCWQATCFFFQMSSDKFFSRYRPSELFGCPIDMAFLDGMHLLEFILRDFIQVEKHSRRNSLIIMHDCIPADANMTSRIHELGTAWTGDVWKILLVLAKYRPDLKIQVLDLPPTGVVICTNLDPRSRVLEDTYHEILEEVGSMTLSGFGFDNFRERIGITGTECTRTFESVSRKYWL